MTAPIPDVKRPSPLLWALEPARALVDLGTYFTNRFACGTLTKGDGHPVMVLPGFLTTDLSTRLLRQFIGDLGYAAEPWGLGRNLGQFENPHDIYPRISELLDIYGEPISLVGWSLGGVYAREIARHYPNEIRQVITLGSPFGGITGDNNAKWIFELIHQKSVEDIDPTLIKDILTPPPVPCTAIYTKRDGVVPWKYCRELTTNKTTQNVEINGSSHIGLGHNKAVQYCLADRLVQDKADWKLFDPVGRERGWYGEV